jgi:hypothetical protein
MKRNMPPSSAVIQMNESGSHILYPQHVVNREATKTSLEVHELCGSNTGMRGEANPIADLDVGERITSGQSDDGAIGHVAFLQYLFQSLIDQNPSVELLRALDAHQYPSGCW